MKLIIFAIIGFICFIPTDMSAAKSKTANTFATPDFAFPQTVASNAEAALKGAEKTGDHLKLIQALMQLTIARQQVSTEAMPEMAAMIERYATSSSGATASILYMLEAQLYNDVYESDSYTFTKRNLPLDSFPDSPMLWSKDLFALKVNDLVSKSLKDRDSLAALPMTQWDVLFTGLDTATAPFYPNLYSVLASIGGRILEYFASSDSVIPFTSTASAASPAQLCSGTLQSIKKFSLSRAEQCAADGEPAWLAIVIRSKSDSDPDSYIAALLEAYKEYKASPYAGEFLVLASQSCRNNQATGQAEITDLLKEAIAAHPDYVRVNALRECLEDFSEQLASVSVPARLLPRKDFSISVKKSCGSGQLYLHLFKITDDEAASNNLSQALRAGNGTKWIYSKPITADTCDVVCDPLPPGHYAAALSTSAADSRKSLILTSYPVDFTVCGLQSFYTAAHTDKDTNRLYILDATNGAPLKGVTVKFSRSAYRKPTLTSSASTNAEGWVEVPKAADGYDRNVEFTATLGDDSLTENIYQYSYSASAPTIRAQVFPSLSIYKPGADCEFAVVTSRSGSGVDQPAPAIPLTLTLLNAAHESVDTLNLTTDELGRAEGRFRLPKDGMNGTFYIAATVDSDKRQPAGGASIRVEEYRRPGFFVELKSKQEYYKLGEEVALCGTVNSYSGMPMAGAEVKVTIKYSQPWWWRYSAVRGTYAASVTTDASGAFSLNLPTASLADTPFAAGSFEVLAEATSSAGETQKSEPAVFSLGDLTAVAITSPDKILIKGDSVTFTAKASGAAETPTLTYTLKNESGDTVSEGRFPAEGLMLPSGTLPSGKYTLRVAVKDNDKAFSSSELILYRSDDKQPPFRTALWLPEESFEAKPREKSVRIPLGTSFADQHILCIVSSSDKILSYKELTFNNANSYIDIPAPAQGQMTFVNFFTVRDTQPQSIQVRITPPMQEIKMEATTFRDKITAGGTERWVFRYTGINTSAASIPVIATLSDQALNAIAPFRWRWQNYGILTPELLTSYRSFGDITRSYNLSTPKTFKYPSLSLPEFNTWNQSLYPFINKEYALMDCATAAPTMANGVMVRGTDGVMVRGTARYAASKQAALTGGVVAEEEMADEGGGDGEVPTQQKEQQFRPADMPLAWFKPMLTTGADGSLEIEFETPDYNTTWQLQMLAYNPDLVSCNSMLSTIASKPVMAQGSAPRFLRTGDRALLPATLFNNTAETASVSGEIILFDPLTGETITSRHFGAEPVAPGASRVISLEFTVPDDIEFIGYKVLARSGNYSDGEQSLIAILPSSTPVNETYPFYLAPAQNEYSTTLPKFKSGSATLQFCDNPVWYCVTALPSLTLNTDASTLSLANSIYGNAVALGLTRQYPQISKAIEAWSESGDSTLVSALERNPELKIIALGSTPWSSNASGETLRMQQLSRLLDSANASGAIDDAVAELVKRQSPGGGWSWCDGMQPSAFITGQVLWRLAMLRHMGYAPASPSLLKAEKDAISYTEKELIDSYRRDKRIAASNLLGWFYVRSFFKEIPATSGMEPIKKAAIADIRKSWKSFSIYHAATAATLLFREGYPMEAREILESLRQKASQSPERGMWFDNLTAGFTGMNNLITTAQALEAFAEIQPGSPCIDPLRQWLLLERQAQDWGTDAQLAEVVWSILSSGTEWTRPSAHPATVTLNGSPLSISAVDQLTGCFTIPLDASAASGAKLSISREGAGPAWGGVATRYIAPIANVKAFSESDVTVTKRLLLVVEDESGTHTEELKGRPLKPGDKVRVQLTVTSKRDIDYAVITDEQAGCLAPVDQLSGYRFGETAYYREVRTGVTNLFIPRLAKGKFLLEYDCYAEGDGSYALGIATLQSLYAPMLSAHSAGEIISVRK